MDYPELYEFEPIHDRAIDLSAEQIQRATETRQTISPEKAWTSYLENLAQIGLETWFEENHLVPLVASSPRQTDRTLITLNQFQVYSLALSVIEDEAVTLPANLAPAHFYVLTTVAEEQNQVWVSGFLRYDQMQALRQASPSKANLPHEVLNEVPIAAFNPKMEALLLALRCASPSSIPLSQSFRDRVSTQISTPVINLRDWLQGQWTAVGETIENTWTPLGPLAEALRESGSASGSTSGSTTGNQGLPQILQSLARRGIRLADRAQGASRVLSIAPIPLRLYVMIGDGMMDETGQAEWEMPEWEMLVVLESATDEPMPTGLSLRIRDDRQTLVEESFDPQSTTDRSLFAEIVSGIEESIFVDIVLPDGSVQTLPKFVYR